MTPPPRPIALRDAVRFYHPQHDKKRTGVVFRIHDDRAFVVFGRGRQLESLGESVAVPFPSSAARSLDLIKPTYFHQKCVVSVRVSALERVGHCPPELFLELLPVALRGVRYMTSLDATKSGPTT